MLSCGSLGPLALSGDAMAWGTWGVLQLLQEGQQPAVPLLGLVQVAGVPGALQHQHLVAGQVPQVAEAELAQLDVLVPIDDQGGCLHAAVALRLKLLGADGRHGHVGLQQVPVLEEEGQRVHAAERRADQHGRGQAQRLHHRLQEGPRRRLPHGGGGRGVLGAAQARQVDGHGPVAGVGQHGQRAQLQPGVRREADAVQQQHVQPRGLLRPGLPVEEALPVHRHGALGEQRAGHGSVPLRARPGPGGTARVRRPRGAEGAAAPPGGHGRGRAGGTEPCRALPESSRVLPEPSRVLPSPARAEPSPTEFSPSRAEPY